MLCRVCKGPLGWAIAEGSGGTPVISNAVGWETLSIDVAAGVERRRVLLSVGFASGDRPARVNVRDPLESLLYEQVQEDLEVHDLCQETYPGDEVVEVAHVMLSRVLRHAGRQIARLDNLQFSPWLYDFTETMFAAVMLAP